MKNKKVTKTDIEDVIAEVIEATVPMGNTLLTVLDQGNELVPDKSMEIILPEQDVNIIALSVKHNLPVLLVGEAGTGKTSIPKRIAHLRKQAYVRVNMTGFTTPDELIGSKSVKDGKTYFEYGIITDAMMKGAILVIDEVNATTPDCLFILHGLLDEDRRITLPNGEIVRPHEDFRVFATCNPDYEGTKSMNKAFLDRFPVILDIETMSPDKEAVLLTSRTGLAEHLANNLVASAVLARKAYLEHKISVFVSTRSLLNTAYLIAQGLTPRIAYQTTVMKKSTNKDEQQALFDFYLATFKEAQGAPSKDDAVITTRRELDSLREDAKKYKTMETERVRIVDEFNKKVLDLTKEKDDATELARKEVDLKISMLRELEQAKEDLKGYKYLDKLVNKTKTPANEEDPIF